jgi:hypothetical protein
MAILAQRFKDTPRINITLRVQRFQTVLFYMVLQTQSYQQISNWEILLWVSYLGTCGIKERDLEGPASDLLDNRRRSDVVINVFRLPRLLVNIQDAGWAVKIYLCPYREVIQVVSLTLLIQPLVSHPAMPFRDRLHFLRDFHRFFLL